MLLGDLGADVMKVEAPGRGDPSREWGLKVPSKNGTDRAESTFFLGVNRNKRSLALDVDNVGDLRTLRKLASEVDVVVTDWTTARATELGLDHQQAMTNSSKLIYCSITGYGQTGPYKDLPAMEGTLCAETGLTFCTGEPDRDPVRPQISPVDHSTAYYAYGSVMAALLSRDNTGSGVYIDVAGFDCQIAAMGNVGAAYLIAGTEYKRVGTAHPTVVPYQVFATEDGSLMIGTGNNSQFERLADAIGHPELAQDPLFATNALRVANRQSIVPVLVKIFAKRTTAEWAKAFVGKGFPFGPINNMEQTFAHPQVAVRGITTDYEVRLPPPT
ncbi:hypothetical protein RQP46_009221 [Phenoliferia psychrophenolica]